MKKLEEFYYDNRKKIYIIIVSIVFIIIISSSIIINKKYSKENKIIEVENPIALTEESSAEEYYYVDIKGYVENPGVYKIKTSSIVNDVIIMSGGLKKDANTRYINLSKKISDEMVIIVYSNEEIENANSEKEIVVDSVPCICENIKNDSCMYESINSNSYLNTSLININSASIEELDLLSGIGIAKAQAIIDYRENNGLFENIEEIKEVSGISESIYSKIKDFITTE